MHCASWSGRLFSAHSRLGGEDDGMVAGDDEHTGRGVSHFSSVPTD